MCRRVQCPSCEKPTFAGCGMHVDQVLGDVPKANRCRCGEKRTDKPAANSTQTSSWLTSFARKVS